MMVWVDAELVERKRQLGVAEGMGLERMRDKKTYTHRGRV